jgi:hypothetical protein
MATAMFVKTLVNTQHSMRPTPESQSYTLNSSCENLRTRISRRVSVMCCLYVFFISHLEYVACLASVVERTVFAFELIHSSVVEFVCFLRFGMQMFFQSVLCAKSYLYICILEQSDYVSGFFSKKCECGPLFIVSSLLFLLVFDWLYVDCV